MRNFLNNILNFISAVSLTDPEFSSVTATETEYDQATYDDLARILAAREVVSDAQERLLGYYKAKGASITALDVAKSEIFLGSTL